MRSNFTLVVKNNSWHETTEVAFLAANCLVLLVTLHVGIVANLFVAWAVHHQKSLQTSNNALLVNLAVIDILRCVVDCPLLLGIVLSARDARDLGLLFCSAQIASFSLICCVQLLTLACISAERYQAIAHPFKNAERRKRITVLIPLTWLLPVSISVVCVIFAKDSPVYVKCRGSRMKMLDYYDTFGFYILTPVWCVCLAVITGYYGRIFLLVRAHGRKVFDKGSFPPPDKKRKEKSNFKSENTEIVIIDNSKPTCEDLLPTSEDLITTVTDSPDVNIAEKSRISFKDELTDEAAKVLEGSVESNNTSAGNYSSKNEVGNKSENMLKNIGQFFSEGVKPNNHFQDVVLKHSQLSEDGECCEEESKNYYMTSETSLPTTNAVFGAVDTDGGVSASSNEERSVKTNIQENITLGSSQSSINGQSCEEEPENDQDNTSGTFPPPPDAAFESSVPEDTSSETLTPGNAEKQLVTQETAEEGSPTSPEGAAAAPHEEKVEEEEVMGAVCMMPSMAQRERGNVKKESKLAKRSGYIICTFLVFWVPLIATVVLNHFCYLNDNLTVEVFQELEILTVSLVCLTSLTNPIIYAAVNPQFRTEFYNLKTKWKAFFTRS